jgi:hypothetical protein
LTVTAEIGPPVATTLTVVLGATESEPLAEAQSHGHGHAEVGAGPDDDHQAIGH